MPRKDSQDTDRHPNAKSKIKLIQAMLPFKQLYYVNGLNAAYKWRRRAQLWIMGHCQDL